MKHTPHRIAFANSPVIAVLLLAASPVIHAQTWENISANFPGQTRNSDASIIASDGDRLYVLGSTGVFMSDNDGESFTAINTVAGADYNLADRAHTALDFAGGFVWLSTNPDGTPGYQRLHRLTPGQTVWERAAFSGENLSGVGSTFPESVAYDGATGSFYFNSALGGVYHSSDGINWQQRTTGFPGSGSPASVNAIDGTVFAIRPGSGGVKRSVDQAQTWIDSPQNDFDSSPLIRTGDSMSYMVTGVSSSSVVYFSHDKGLTWEVSLGHPPGMRPRLSGDGERLYAATQTARLLFSNNAGLTWQDLPTTGLSLGGSGIGAQFPRKMARHKNYLFMGLSEVINVSFSTEERLFRLDLADVDFRNATTILQQPEAAALFEGGTVQFSVSAVGENLTYQWQRNSTDLPGETDPVLTLPNVTTENAGNYTVVVTGDRGTVTSFNANLTVYVMPLPGQPDPSFKTFGYSGNVATSSRDTTAGSSIGLQRVLVRPDGRFWVAGHFTNSMTGPNARTNDSVTLKRVLDTGFYDGKPNPDHRDQATYGAFLEPDGGIVATRFLGDILRYDASMNRVGSGPIARVNGKLFDIARLPDGSFFVAGEFTEVRDGNGQNGIARRNIALLNADGSLDTSFAQASNFTTFQAFIRTLTYDPANQKIYVGGNFDNWPGAPSGSGLVRLNLDGSLDSSFTANLANIRRIILQPDGKILIGRDPFAGQSGITRLLPNGSVDPDWNPGGSGANGRVTQVALNPDGGVIIGGDFTTYNGTSPGRFLLLNPDGTRNTVFNPGGNGPQGDVGGIAVSADGQWILMAMQSDDYHTSNGTQKFAATTSFGSPIYAGNNLIRIRNWVDEPLIGGPGGFANWPALLDLPEDQRGPLATPAGDDVANLVKYAIGVGPLDSAAGRIPQEVVSGSVDDENYPVVCFIRDTNATGVAIQVEVATDLDFTTNLGSTVISTEGLGGGLERVCVRSNARFADHASQFFRLKVSEE